MFSPGLPTAIQQSYPVPPFPLGGPGAPLQTPLQANFFAAAGPPGAPGRPNHLSHKARASMAQLAAAGIMPPPGVPMTPLGGAFPMMGAPGGPGAGGRNRRAPSISVGGPPKAVLGGPGRKHEPVPVPQQVAQAQAPPPPKQKKVVINLPKETVKGEGDEASTSTRASFARTPVPAKDLPAQVDVPGPELTTADERDSDVQRYAVPDTVDVFLPGRVRLRVLCYASFSDSRTGSMD
jgi:hypothetical protein